MQIRKGPRDPRLGDADEAYGDETDRGLDAIPDFSTGPARPSWRREPLSAPKAERPVPPLVPTFDAPEAAAPPVAAAAAPSLSGESTISADSSFDGRYESEGDLRLLGRISGEVVCRGQITVERGASANAKVQARDIVVRGMIEGEVTCTGRLEIEANASVSGKVRTATLVVHEGGALSGAVETTAAAPAGQPPAPRATKREAAAPEGDTGNEPAPAPRTARARDLPSFALVSSEERPAPEKTPATAR